MTWTIEGDEKFRTESISFFPSLALRHGHKAIINGLGSRADRVKYHLLKSESRDRRDGMGSRPIFVRRPPTRLATVQLTKRPVKNAFIARECDYRFQSKG